MRSFSLRDDSKQALRNILRLVMCSGCVLLMACASQAPPAETAPAPVVTPAVEDVAGEDPAGGREAAPAAEPDQRPLKDRRGILRLLAFEPRPGHQQPTGEALETLAAGHRETLENLHGRGLRAASLRSEDGWWFLILDAPTAASLDERLSGDPLLNHDDLRLSAAGFEFTVGWLCEAEPGPGKKVLQMLWFTRDRTVLESGANLAPAPFGPELAALDEVVAAGPWGYGHLGFVFVDLASPAAAEELLDAFPAAVDPQWSYTVHTVRASENTFCR